VCSLSKTPQQKLKGVSFECVESGELFTVEAKTVINATGAFCDDVRKLSDSNSEKLILPSQGIHLVFDSSFLAGRDAIMIPKTSDGRVLFVIPWNDKTLVGTTDTPIENPVLEPKPISEEIEFVLNTCKSYLAKPPTFNDVLSVFAGIRPLVKSGAAVNTASLSRDHTIEIDNSGLITITGGKWTTYRRMAEDGVNKAVGLGGLPGIASSTKSLKIETTSLTETSDIAFADPDSSKKIHPEFIYLGADVVNAVRNEMARTVEDVLARRTRFLFLDANLAIEVSPKVAAIMAKELGESGEWVDSQIRDFKRVAENYLA